MPLLVLAARFWPKLRYHFALTFVQHSDRHVFGERVELLLRLRIDGALYDSRNPFDVIEAHVRFARQLDEIGPDSFGVR